MNPSAAPVLAAATSRSGGGPRLARIIAPNFDLGAVLESGQVFHWRRFGAGWLGTVGSEPVYLESDPEGLWMPAQSVDSVRRYLGLDHPIEQICASFPKDPALNAALEFCPGLRILRQPTWECLATFITSAMKQVAHISQMSHALRQRFGEPLCWGDQGLYAYPSAARLAQASEEELRACGLGFRAGNMLRSARMIDSGEVNLEAVEAMSDEAARAELCRLPGVGEKVANCALLFGFGRLAAFPIDVWIERILRQLYFAGRRKVTTNRLREFSETYFGAYGGYAQQFLFHHARLTWGRGEKKPSARAKIRSSVPKSRKKSGADGQKLESER